MKLPEIAVEATLDGRDIKLNGHVLGRLLASVCKSDLATFALALARATTLDALALVLDRGIPDARPGRRKARRMALRGY